MSDFILPYSPIRWKMTEDHIFDVKNMNLTDEIFNKLLFARSINTVCYGGLLEAYLSLVLFEKLDSKRYSKLFWIGSEKFYDLVKWQGLASVKNIEEKLFENYPCPIINDLENNIYFNCLFNTKDRVQDMWGIYLKPIDRTFYVRRILFNFLMKANKKFFPKWRNQIIPTNKFQLWLDLNKDLFNKKIILLLPDHMSNYSTHKFINLNWNINEIKAFIALAKTLDFEVIVLSDHVKKYYGNIKFYEFTLESFFFLLEKCSAVISADIDISTITALHSDKMLMLKKSIFPQHFKYDAVLLSQLVKRRYTIYNQITVENAFKFLKRVYKKCQNPVL